MFGSATPGWPVTLRAGEVALRPHRRDDAAAWSRIRLANEAWLSEWEPSSTVPWQQRHQASEFRFLYKALRAGAKAGSVIPFAITVGGEFAGQLSLANVVRGALGSASAGYWLDQRFAGRGIMPLALALSVDFALGVAQLHRVEVDVRPENEASIRVVQKLGFRHEGYHRNYMYVNGQWRDHECYALTVEDLPVGGLATTLLEGLRIVSDK